jgi:hypothetical protein
MRRQDTNTLALERVPDITVKVIVASKQQTPRHGKGERGNATEDVIMRVLVHLSIGTKVKQTTRCVIRSTAKGVSVGEKSVLLSLLFKKNLYYID